MIVDQNDLHGIIPERLHKNFPHRDRGGIDCPDGKNSLLDQTAFIVEHGDNHLLALFPAVNGYFFLPNYPTQVAAIGFDRTGTTKIGKYVINHSFQLAGFITTVVSIGLGYLIIQFL